MGRYRFSNDWFVTEGIEECWEANLKPFAKYVDTYLEIGVCEGRSMLWVLENMEPTLAYGIDPFDSHWQWQIDHGRREKQKPSSTKYRDNATRNLSALIVSGRVKLIEEPSQICLLGDAVPNNSIDLAYVDGSHWAWDTITDLVLVWRKMKIGGIILLDDLNRRWLIGKPQVRVAWMAFAECFENRAELLWMQNGPCLTMRQYERIRDGNWKGPGRRRQAAYVKVKE